MTDRYDIVLDQSLCSGMGDCVRNAPDVFALRSDGTAELLVAATDDAAALEAVRSCPMAAIAAYRSGTNEQVA